MQTTRDLRDRPPATPVPLDRPSLDVNAEDAAAPSRDPSPAHILVVDDDPVMRELLEMLLALKGHTVETSSSGTDALHRLAEVAADAAAFDIVLTDFHMPGLAGAGLAEALLAVRQPGQLLIGMSGSSPEPEVIPLFDAFLRKPFQSEEFDEALRQAAIRQTARREETAEPATTVHGADPLASTDELTPTGTPVLQESTFQQLAAMLPAAQLRELFRITVEDVAARHSRMVAHAAAGDLKAVQREAHAVKGGCGMVGALELQTLATAVEGGSDLGTAPLSEFPAACVRLRRMLDARLKID